MSQMSSEGRKVGMFDPERRGGGGEGAVEHETLTCVTNTPHIIS